jgi:MYXO-CTERM domain-containing protein
MEPYTTLPAKHDLDLTLPALLDLGWAGECGNGRIDSGETCDDGAELSDRLSDRCRTNCTRARCGDSVEDRGEACDDGLKNSDVQAGACRSDCTLARCGDGVRDDGEACDGEADCSTRCTLERAAGGAGSRSAGTSGAGTGDEPDDDVAASEEREPESQSGCSCAVGSTSKGRDGANALLCLGVVWLWTRRHRRR